MINFKLAFQLNISSGHDRNRGMTDWIDKFDSDSKDQRIRQERRRSVFGPKARRTWEALSSQIGHDAARMNASPNVKAAMRGEIQINRRETVPIGDDLQVDKPYIPSVYLTISLDIGAESIRIEQRRKEILEGDYKDTIERLSLDLDDFDQMTVRNATGLPLTIESASEYILRRFLN